MKCIYLVLLSMASMFVCSEVYEVGQKDKTFTVEVVKIKKGDKVSFKNEDPFFHNVFSLSDSKMFDLGSFPKGEAREVEFTEAGEVEIECAIHPNMKMKVIVE